MSTKLNFVAGNIWQVSHQCHQRQDFFKYRAERRRYLYWLFQARRRFGLCLLNFSLLPSEIRLLVMDRGRGEIPCSLQLLSAGMAQDYKHRHSLLGRFWEATYQAQLLRPTDNLLDAIVQIDLTPVHQGYVNHPRYWQESGYNETLHPPKRSRRIDLTALQRLLNPLDIEHLQSQRQSIVNQILSEFETFEPSHAWEMLPGNSTKNSAYSSANRRMPLSNAMLPASKFTPSLVPKRSNS